MRSGALGAAAVSLAALGGCTSSAVPSTGPELLAVAVEALEEAASFIGRYVTGPGDAARDLPVSIDYVTAELISSPDEVADAVETTYVNGRPVFVVTADDGRRLAVTASEPHYPLRLVIPVDEEFDGRGAKDGTVRFSRFGERETIARPENPVTQDELDG